MTEVESKYGAFQADEAKPEGELEIRFLVLDGRSRGPCPVCLDRGNLFERKFEYDHKNDGFVWSVKLISCAWCDPVEVPCEGL